MPDEKSSASPSTKMVSPEDVDPGLPITQDYSIWARPHLTCVTPGAKVRYCILYKGGTEPFPTVWRDLYSEEGRILGQYRDGYTWFNLPSLTNFENGDGGYVERGPLLQTKWEYEWPSKEGKFVIACQIYNSSTRKKTWCFLGQRVIGIDAALAPMWYETRKQRPAHPDEAVGHVNQLIRNWKLAVEKFPISDPEHKKQFDQNLKQTEEYGDRLNAWLEPTAGLNRIPIHAVHFGVEAQRAIALNVFIAKVKTIPAHFQARGDREIRVPESQVWTLVDWTDPTDPRFVSEWSRAGETTNWLSGP